MKASLALLALVGAAAAAPWGENLDKSLAKRKQDLAAPAFVGAAVTAPKIKVRQDDSSDEESDAESDGNTTAEPLDAMSTDVSDDEGMNNNVPTASLRPFPSDGDFQGQPDFSNPTDGIDNPQQDPPDGFQDGPSDQNGWWHGHHHPGWSSGSDSDSDGHHWGSGSDSEGHHWGSGSGSDSDSDSEGSGSETGPYPSPTSDYTGPGPYAPKTSVYSSVYGKPSPWYPNSVYPPADHPYGYVPPTGYPSYPTTTPCSGKPEYPMSSSPSYPMNSYPSNNYPSNSYPAKPAESYPAKPAESYPAKPAESYPAKPGNSYPAGSMTTTCLTPTPNKPTATPCVNCDYKPSKPVQGASTSPCPTSAKPMVPTYSAAAGANKPIEYILAGAIALAAFA